MWDPDGTGPAQPLLVVGGDFDRAGDKSVEGLATYDPTSGRWGAFSTPPAGQSASMDLRAVLPLPNGDLIVAGNFSSLGGVSGFNSIARWNGVTWSPLGNGISGRILSLALLPNGDIVAAGEFDIGSPGNKIARWNGISWAPFGSGLNGTVNAVAARANGDVIVGGSFSTAGGVPAVGLARWDGSSWHSMPDINGAASRGVVRAIETDANGDLLVGGQFGWGPITFPQPFFTWQVARWDGATWTGLFQNNSINTYAITTRPNGDIIASMTGTNRLVRWDGTTWTSIAANGGVAVGLAYALAALPNGNVVAGGDFRAIEQVPMARIGLWDGSTWSRMSPGMDAPITELAMLANGDVVACGEFKTAGTSNANHIARWDGTNWFPYGSGVAKLGSFSAVVNALAPLPDGGLLIAGDFTSVDGVAVPGIARHSGNSWLPVGSGVTVQSNEQLLAVAQMQNGDVVVGGDIRQGYNYIRRWDGISWQSMGTGMNQSVNALLAMPNGDLIAGGNFTTAGGTPANRIAIWNGSVWAPLGSGMNGTVLSLMLEPNGDVIAGGVFTTAGGVNANRLARWDGSTWSPYGAGPPGGGLGTVSVAMTTLPNGELLADGARWDGLAWVPFATKLRGAIHGMARLPDGNIIVAGSMGDINNVSAPFISRLTSTCPPTSTNAAAGCPSSGGANALAVITLPWVGGRFHSRVTGVPALSLVMSVVGFSTLSLPLSQVFPQAPPGCTGNVSPDLTFFLFSGGGTADFTVTIPNDRYLTGLSFYHQMIPIEVDAAQNVVSVTATNSLAMIVGAY